MEVFFQQIHKRWAQIDELASETMLLGSYNPGFEDRTRFFMGKSQCQANLLPFLNVPGGIHLNEKTVQTEIDDLRRFIHAHHADGYMKCNARGFASVRVTLFKFFING